MIDPKKEAELHEELRIFEEFIKSGAWLVIKRQWEPLVRGAIGVALAGRSEDRSWAAGKAVGMKLFLEYPEKHIRTLQSRLKGLPDPD